MKAPYRHYPKPLLKRLAGVTLIELMVALAIGSFLMIGAVTVFMQSRTTFRINEAVARLQENGRFALDALEPNIRMAHYWGLTARTTRIANRATPADPVPAGLGVGGQNCGNNWAINLREAVGGSNNFYGWPCAASGGAQPLADTLVIRRVSEDPLPAAALEAGTMYVQSARFQDGQIFVGTAIPAGFLPATSQTHQLMADGYYISQTSSVSTPDNQVPSLRVKTLVGTAAGPVIQDQEILPGVEDLQVQFGIDTDPVGTANRGTVDRYVNAGAPIIDPANAAFDPDAEILAVRIWLRLRAERPENGFTDTTNYVYADQNVPAPNDAFRRAIVSKTIYLRNARPAT